MKTSAQKRIARLSGLLLLSLLVVALAVPAAQAMRFSGTINTAQRPTQAQLQSAHGGPSGSYVVSGSGTLNAAQRPTQAQFQRAHYGPSVVSGGGTLNAAQSASSGISSTTVWIAAVAVLGALLIGTWALTRRRRQRNAAPICEVEPAGC